MLKKYKIPEEYWEILDKAPELTGFSMYKLSDLLKDSTFYIMPSEYMGGITFHKNFILLHKDFLLFSQTKQLRLLAHEGYHVAQQKKWSWISFMWKYIREWISCGFSYQKMKSVGIEKAAYDYEKLFAQQLLR